MHPTQFSDSPSTPPLSPSSSPEQPASTLTSDSSLSLPLSHLDLLDADKQRHSQSPHEPRNARLTHVRKKLGLMERQVDEDAVMLDDEDWDTDEDEDEPMEYSAPPSTQQARSSARPHLIHRQSSSYSKRHASLDTPREVPFPSFLYSQPPFSGPSATSSDDIHNASLTAGGPSSYPPFVRSSSQPTTDVIDAANLARQDQPPAYENVDDARPVHDLSAVLHTASSTRGPRSPSASGPSRVDMAVDESRVDPPSSSAAPVAVTTDDIRQTTPFLRDGVTAPPSSLSPPSSSPTAVLPFGRPVSSPSGPTPPLIPSGRFQPGSPSASQWHDRASTASLPLPLHTPMRTLPPVRTRPSEAIAENLPAAGPSNTDTPEPRLRPIATAMQRGPSSPAAFRTTAPPPYSAQGIARTGSTSDYSPVVPARVRAAAAAAAAAPASSRTLPPPAPPTILAPPDPRGDRGFLAPHEPFLSDAPAPADSWIAVETFPNEYHLVVRLPGFQRDAIMLTTRRRRVLHLVADSWGAGGGHFERRISFGYDADLARVRAEFDGELLRVIIPRRIPSMTWYGEALE